VDLLIDTQILVWLQTGDRRLTQAARTAIFDRENRLFVSAVRAWEYSDLVRRGRLPVEDELDQFVADSAMNVIDFPSNAWQKVRTLPDIHRDPVDRMLIAHAITLDAILVTSDTKIRRYPVNSIW
jgi:PIN domain nuclease of toxin-antitoxin system